MSTSKGAEGLDVVHDKDIIIADNKSMFADGVLDLLTHPEKASSLGLNGKKLVEARYSWENIVSGFMKKIDK